MMTISSARIESGRVVWFSASAILCQEMVPRVTWNRGGSFGCQAVGACGIGFSMFISAP